MALYLGSNGRLKINLNGIIYRLASPSIISDTDIIRLLSSDDYILKDINDIYLLPSESMEEVIDNLIILSNNYILADSNGSYLTFKESD